jgi:hypothetical protein
LQNSLPEKSLPELISLAVVRSDYCDQATTDQICQHLWATQPELIAQIAREEGWDFPECRSSVYRELIYTLGESLREDEVAGALLPSTPLALLDFIYELSRRLRKVLGAPELSVLGKPLMDGPEAELPPLLNRGAGVPISAAQWGESDDARADAVCRALYESDPELLYALCAQERRLQSIHEIENALTLVAARVLVDEGIDDIDPYRAELLERLSLMCDLPPYEELEARLSS